MKKLVEDSRNAAKGAFKDWHNALGIQTDSDVDLYKSLKQEDFDKISQKYGTEETITYIREMESRIQKERK